MQFTFIEKRSTQTFVTILIDISFTSVESDKEQTRRNSEMYVKLIRKE